MGMAAYLPGMQYALELMTKQLDDFRAQLSRLQNGDQPKPKRHISPEGAKAISDAQKKRWAKVKRVSSWAKFKTPEARAAEMKRRIAARKKNGAENKAAA